MKQGVGVLKKGTDRKEKQLLDAITNRTYKMVVAELVEAAELEAERARGKVRKVQGLFTGAPLKEVIKAFGGGSTNKKDGKDLYVGDWQEDKRHGWGIYSIKGDRYKG
jgi:hypothetical protein